MNGLNVRYVYLKQIECMHLSPGSAVIRHGASWRSGLSVPLSLNLSLPIRCSADDISAFL